MKDVVISLPKVIILYLSRNCYFDINENHFLHHAFELEATLLLLYSEDVLWRRADLLQPVLSVCGGGRGLRREEELGQSNSKYSMFELQSQTFGDIAGLHLICVTSCRLLCPPLSGHQMLWWLIPPAQTKWVSVCGFSCGINHPHWWCVGEIRTYCFSCSEITFWQNVKKCWRRFSYTYKIRTMNLWYKR